MKAPEQSLLKRRFSQGETAIRHVSNTANYQKLRQRTGSYGSIIAKKRHCGNEDLRSGTHAVSTCEKRFTAFTGITGVPPAISAKRETLL
jgi:hypothetical protein